MNNKDGFGCRIDGRTGDGRQMVIRIMGLAAIFAVVLAMGATAQEAQLGAVTHLPLPRYVSLKTNEGNARRGPGLTHRIDWVFSRAGMPLRVTAEYENWRRIEDSEGQGGWVHYSLLSGSRTALVTADLLDIHSAPLADASVEMRAEAGVIAKIVECKLEWCRLSLDGEKGWAQKSGIWGVDPAEVFE